MGSNKDRNYFLRNMRRKHRLSVRDEHDDTEVWYMHISPLNLLAGFFSLVLILFVIILTTVAYTPILDLIPGYPGNKSRELLIANIARLDSLERELSGMQVFNENVTLIMQGKMPVTSTVGLDADTVRRDKSVLVPRSVEDSLLRQQFEHGGLTQLGDPTAVRRTIRSSMELYSPARGVVASHFNPRQNQFGVEIATASNQQVMSVADGTIVMSVWTPDDGYIIQVQHPNNLISVYKHCARALLPLGSRVKSGEVIGYTGEGLSGNEGKGTFAFELWQNGSPVDPENYIVF